MSLRKRIIRRKKCHAKRQVVTSQCNLSTEENNYNMDCLVKIYNNKTDFQPPETFGYSTQRLNHSEMSNVTQRLIGMTSPIADNSDCESPKESELGSTGNTSSSSQNGIDVDKSWDYYQTIYTEDDGDSQILEIDNIKEWEPDVDTDGGLLSSTSDYLPNIAEKKLPMLTSGYETAPESDSFICTKSWLCVLEFTSNYHSEIDKKIQLLSDRSEEATPLIFEAWMGTISQCLLLAKMHSDLIDEILCKDPCTAVVNTPLFDNLKVLQNKWDSLKYNCVITQLNIIKDRMKSFDKYMTIEELKDIIDSFQEIETSLHQITFNLNGIDQEEILRQEIEMIQERLMTMKEVKVTELDSVLQSVTVVTRSRYTRGVCERAMNLATEDNYCRDSKAKEIVKKSENFRISLYECRNRLYSITGSCLQTHMTSAIDKELLSWTTLCDHVTNLTQTMTTNEVVNGSSPLALPCHMLLYFGFVIVVIILVWLSVLSKKPCSQLSSNWIRFLYTKQYHLEPH